MDEKVLFSVIINKKVSIKVFCYYRILLSPQGILLELKRFHYNMLKINPVLCYLDLVYLTEITKNQENDADHFLKRLYSLKNQSRIIFPFSLNQFIEFSENSQKIQKSNLFNIFNKLSNNYAIRDFQTIIFAEILNKFSIHFNKTEILIDCLVLPKGLAVTGDSFKFLEKDKLSLSSINSDIFNFLSTFTFPVLKGEGQEYNEFKIRIERNRQLAGKKSANKMIDEMFIKMLPGLKVLANKALQILSVDVEDYQANPLHPDYFTAASLTENFPSLDVWSKLNLYYWTHPEIKIDPELMYNSAFYSVVIPYCDMVLTSKKIAGIFKDYNLGEKYKTAIFAESDENFFKAIESKISV